MDEVDFWYLISSSKDEAQALGLEDLVGNQLHFLKEALEKMEASDLIGFQEMVDGLMHDAYGYDLWGAAYLITGGLSPDDFECFRARLILVGKEAFEAALQEPDSLAQYDQYFHEGLDEARDLLFLALELYEEVSGDGAIYERTISGLLMVPRGDNFDESDTRFFQETYPNLWAKYCEEEILD